MLCISAGLASSCLFPCAATCIPVLCCHPLIAPGQALANNDAHGSSTCGDNAARMQTCKAAHQAGLPATWRALATELCQRYSGKAQSWCILADAAAEDCQFKLAMMAYHQCWSMSQDAKVQSYCIQVRVMTPSTSCLELSCLPEALLQQGSCICHCSNSPSSIPYF